MAAQRATTLTGQTALVTGAGTGIGRASSLALAAAGARVMVTEIPGKGELAADTVAALAAEGGTGTTQELDVTDMASIQRCADAAAAFGDGRIDILVNNAGINVPKMAFDVEESDWDRVLDVNLKGIFFMAQAVGKVMRDQSPAGGSIINIASQMGLVGYVKRAAYCSSKAGAVNLSRVLCFEWADYNIRVNAVCPTFVDTPLTRPMFEDEAFKADVLSRIPLGRLATPDEVAAAVVYLASPAASIVSGIALPIDGGWTAV